MDLNSTSKDQSGESSNSSKNAATISQQANTPMTAPSPIPAAQFYRTSATNPPPLPERSGVGSSSTVYHDPSDAPPTYSAPNSPMFREPETVADGTTMEDIDNWSHQYNNDTWDHIPVDSWTPLEPLYQNSSNFASQIDAEFLVAGRCLKEEEVWWDPVFRENYKRPGQGILAPTLYREFHDSDHTLYTVSASQPKEPAKAASASPDKPDSGPSAVSPPASSPKRPISFEKPSDEELRQAVPHPNAYYCYQDHGWLLFAWKSSSVAPPFADSFIKNNIYLLPDASRRMPENCATSGDGNGKCKTHHFHFYQSAVDSLKLTSPYHVDEWESAETVKQKRRAGTVISDDFSLEKLQEELGREDDVVNEPTEGKLLDLYMCCQCTFYVISSSIIPGVIPRRIWDAFLLDRKNNPVVGKTVEEYTALTMTTMMRIIENRLWQGESRQLRVERTAFKKKLGWNSIIETVFSFLGFTPSHQDNEVTLVPPATEGTTSQARQNRAKLLRAWVEIGAWYTIYCKKSKFPSGFIPSEITVTVETTRDAHQLAIGAHPDQIPRNAFDAELSQILQHYTDEWRTLSLTPAISSPDMLAFTYLAQCRCDPAGTPSYFTALCTLAQTLLNLASPSELDFNVLERLTELIASERSRGRFSLEDFHFATNVLGFGADGPAKIEYDPDMNDEYVKSAWANCLKTARRDQNVILIRDINNAFRIVAQMRNSRFLYDEWDKSVNRMQPDQAYDTLRIVESTPDDMIVTIFPIYMDEQTSNKERLQEALAVIAEARDSHRLREYIRTGIDPGEVVAPMRTDWPRGLNQLGNTCYLNSLLQYFYTIKDLREAVRSLFHIDAKTIEDDNNKLSDDELKRHRVGGRLVTRREVARSKQFINHLAELFYKLETSDDASITPSLELAKLALVTSKDEEEDEADVCGTDTSNDTDATLVEDGPSRFNASENAVMPLSPTRSGSILGKRHRDFSKSNEGHISSHQRNGLTTASPPSSNFPTPGSSYEAGPSSITQDDDGDVRMRSRSPSPSKKVPPPLPPRKPEPSDSVMMFGKQHDVAECMDNCMFQIETALLKFDGMSDLDDGSDKTSVVKRLFYGKLRQNLGTPSKSKTPVEAKEDLFSHLLVNVAEEGFDIYDGLGRFFDDVVEYEGESVPMQISLVDAPPILQVQLQRVQFDRDTLQQWKSQAYVKFGETIYLDRFMENADADKRSQSRSAQEQLDTCRERISALTRGKDGVISDVLENVREFFISQDLDDVDDKLVFDIGEEKALIEFELTELRSKMTQLKEELENLWKDNTEVAYELTSVFIHRGSSPSWGHYFFYSRYLPEQPDEWFKYNDSDVTSISKEEVLADTTGSTANPYLLVYVRKGSEVVDTVKRFDPAQLVDSDTMDCDS